MFFAGGFVPRRFSQCAKDPILCSIPFWAGFWSMDNLQNIIKLNSCSLVPDPNRYKYNVFTAH